MGMMRSPKLALLALALVVGVSARAMAQVPPGRYAIGDSVMLGARTQLIARGFRVNAEVSRQFRDAPHLVHHLAIGGHLPVDVVVHLGTNGPIDGADCDALIRAAGTDRHVFLVTVKMPRWWRDQVNWRLHACARRHANASIIDWYGYSHDHTTWFYADGFHLTPAGREAYAAFLDRSVSAG